MVPDDLVSNQLRPGMYDDSYHSSASLGGRPHMLPSPLLPRDVLPMSPLGMSQSVPSQGGGLAGMMVEDALFVKLSKLQAYLQNHKCKITDIENEFRTELTFIKQNITELQKQHARGQEEKKDLAH